MTLNQELNLKSHRRGHLALLLLTFALISAAHPINSAVADDQDRVIWYGTLDGGLAEAKRSNRPVLLLSAAPHCQAVSGIW